MRSSKWISLVLLLATVSVGRADDSWRDGEYSKTVVRGEAVPIKKLLSDFGQAQRVPVIIDEEISGDVVTQYPAMRPEDYLNALSGDNGLFWFEKNGTIFVYPSSKLESKIVRLGAVPPERLIDVLRRFNLYSESFPLKADAELGLAYVTGPADYLAEVEKIVSGIASTRRGDPSVDVQVEVFHLQHAWADDRTFTLANREVAIPGIATILRNVLTGKVGAGGLQGRVSTVLPNNRSGLRGTGLIGPYNQLIASSQQAAVDSQVAAAQAEARFQATTAAQEQINEAIAAVESADPDARARRLAASQVKTVIQADPRLNAIIIKDVRERLDEYREIIRRLDQPVSLVEIKASIIDVDATQGFEFGLPGNVTFNNDGTQRSILGNLGTRNLATLGASGNLTFQLADGAVNQLLVNLKALETDGHARLQAKPAIVTLDNQDAFLEESEEFFVRVQGNQQVDLFNVTVGTKMNITPHIIRGVGGRRIRLSVNIEDGSRSATQQVDAIPVVSRNTINTQAVLMEGQSLLVGGLTRERETKNIRSVPLLGRIPKVGALFRETVHETARLERLILLKPTIIDLPCCSAAETEQMFSLPPGMEQIHDPHASFDHQEIPVIEDPVITLPPQDTPAEHDAIEEIREIEEIEEIFPVPIEESAPREGTRIESPTELRALKNSRTSGFLRFASRSVGKAKERTKSLLHRASIRKTGASK